MARKNQFDLPNGAICEGLAPGRDGPERSVRQDYSTGLMASVGGFWLPQKAGLSTFSLVMAAPGILMSGPQASLVTVDFRPITSYSPGLISSFLTILSMNMATAAACA